MIRILLIGPLPPPMGGDTRHFATLLEDLQNNVHFTVQVLNTSRGLKPSNPLRNIAVTCKTIFAIILNLRSVDIISYHASDRGMFHFGPIIVALSKLGGIPVVLRLFGGSFATYYESKNNLQKAVLGKLVSSSDVVLLQTKLMIGQLQKQVTGRLEWFSTYIKVSNSTPAQAAAEKREACRRFIFLGHVAKKKGIETLLEAVDHLPDGSSIDIYGQLDEYSEQEIRERGMGRVRYCGFLTHTEVDAKLWEYDCLVLPTYHHGEGYPGVIAEAYAHGIPVITTNWMAIPEIVDDGCGILIEPKDTDAFVCAISQLCHDQAHWKKLKQGAINKARLFDHSVWSKKFEKICEELVAK